MLRQTKNHSAFWQLVKMWCAAFSSDNLTAVSRKLRDWSDITRVTWRITDG